MQSMHTLRRGISTPDHTCDASATSPIAPKSTTPCQSRVHCIIAKAHGWANNELEAHAVDAMDTSAQDPSPPKNNSRGGHVLKKVQGGARASHHLLPYAAEGVLSD